MTIRYSSRRYVDCITDISMRGERCIDVGINLRMNRHAHKHIHVIASQPGEKIVLRLVFSLLLPFVVSLLLWGRFVSTHVEIFRAKETAV